MTTDEVLASLSDEQLDVLIADADFRGPGRKRLEQEKVRRSDAQA